MADPVLVEKKDPDFALETESDDPDSLNTITALVAEGWCDPAMQTSFLDGWIGYLG